MVVCKFYAQGTCKFGNNCKFEHSQSQYQLSRYQQSNNYQQQARSQQNNQDYIQQPNPAKANLFTNLVTKKPQTANATDPDNILSDEEFLNFISSEFQEWLNSSMWKLSGYKYNKTAKNLPILQDVSSEEARFALYEAKKQNRYSAELQQFQVKYNQAIETIKQIAMPSQQTKQYLIKYFHESEHEKLQKKEKQQTPVNPFVQIIQKKQQELQQQAFPQNNVPLFQQNTTSPLQQGFLQQQGTNRIQTSNSFLFTNTNTPVQNQIDQSQKAANPFTLLTAGQAQPVQAGIFNNPTNSQSSLLNNQQMQQQPDINPDPRVYSNTSDLNELDVKEFKSDQFTLGLIPHRPPTKQLCI